ncbi:MAG: BamA/TamA family outer membrane protein [Saprospiraceae bacterium]
MKRFSFLFILTLITVSINAQSLFIDSILYEGNTKTKNYIIRRELNFKENDTISLAGLTQKFNQNRSRILNTGLFKDVYLNIKSWNTESNHISILIKVQEAWYIYPIPIFELADRNFNVWWDQFNGSLKRVNLGIKFIHSNLTGQADALKITLQGGYSTKIDLEYSWPFWGLNRNWRFTSKIFYAQNKESYFNTVENQLAFYKSADDDYSLHRMRFNTGLENRISLQLFQRLELEYSSNKTSNEISKVLNPDFFLNNKASQNFLSLKYQIRYDDRDLKYYPGTGHLAELNIIKEGLGNEKDLNTLYTNITLQQFIPWSKKHNAGIMIRAKGSIIRDQIPYYNSRALGYGENYLKGYEYYVVDGLDYFFLKFRERFVFYDKKVTLFPKSKFGIKSKPVKLGISAHASTGYVNNVYYSENNSFGNRWLYSSGLSLECLLSNTSFIQLDWSVNHLKQSGFFLHFKDDF